MLALEQQQSLESQIIAVISKFIPEGYKINFCLTREETTTQQKLAEIIRGAVCNYFDLSITQLQRRTRKGEIVLARKFVCYFLKEYTSLNLTDIAKYSGYSDDNDSVHANAIHNISTLRNWIKTDETIAFQFSQISQILKTNIAA